MKRAAGKEEKKMGRTRKEERTEGKRGKVSRESSKELRDGEIK